MKFPCPKCGTETEPRRVKITQIAGGPSAGLLYALFFPFFTKRCCPEHGFIDPEEFPASARNRLKLFPVLWLAGCMAVLVGVGWAIHLLNDSSALFAIVYRE